MHRAVLPAFAALFTAVALALLVVVSTSAPINKSLVYLKAVIDGRKVFFGNFGFCVADACSDVSVGYDLENVSSSLLGPEYADALPDKLSHALVLNPIAAAISALAIIFDLASFCAAAPVVLILASTVTALATIFALAAFVVCMVLFPLASKRFEDEGAKEATLGSANWLVAAALALLVIALVISLCALRRRKRMSKYEEVEMI